MKTCVLLLAILFSQALLISPSMGQGVNDETTGTSAMSADRDDRGIDPGWIGLAGLLGLLGLVPKRTHLNRDENVRHATVGV
jgi:hypothetical protein